MTLFFLENNIVTIIMWLAIFFIAIAVELATTELVSVWFSGGALISLILACFDVDWVIQLIVFVVVSAVLLILTRPFVRKKLNSPSHKTNVDSLIGKEIIILSKVDKLNPGEGKVRDVIWTCITYDEEGINPGDIAKIKDIDGNKLIITKKGE